MEVIRVPVLSDNYSYILRDEGEDQTAVVDPGEAGPVLDELSRRSWGLDVVINTHHHHDHVGGNSALRSETGCAIVAPSRERNRIADVDGELSEHRPFAFGNSSARVLFTPGHTAGHVSLWFEREKFLFCGDVLFAMGCGRLFEGSPSDMWGSLQALRSLSPETIVHCGHEYTLSNARFAVTVDPENETLARRLRDVEQARGAGEPTVPYRLADDLETNPFLRPQSAGIRATLGMQDADDLEVFTEIRRRKDRF